MNYAEWKFWIDLLVLVVVAGNTVYTWWTNREKVTNKKFQETERRLLQLENDVKHPPACTYHAGLESRIAEVHGDTREIKGKLDGINRAVDLINEFLINQGGRK